MNNNNNKTNLSVEADEQKKSGNNKKIRIAIVTAGVIIILAIIFFVIFVTQNKVDDKQDLIIQDFIEQDDPKDESNDIKKVSPIRYGKMWLDTSNKEINIGDEIEVDILMDTQKSNIVLAMAIIEFDDTVLEFIGEDNIADVEDSVLDMSVFNLRRGNKVEIVRGTPGDTDYLDTDDGFNGSEGLLGTLKFKVLKTGTTEVVLGEICRPEISNEICDQSSMILDDGNGTAMKIEFEDLELEIK
jgi:hypothetical protein